MMWRILWLVIGAWFSITAAHAQDTQSWYWARTNDSGLVAYTQDGTINHLIESGVEDTNFRAWRLAPDSALGIITIANELKLYHLTADAAQEIETPFPLVDSGWVVPAHTGNNIVLLSVLNVQEVLGMLVNVEQNSASPLTGQLSLIGVARPVFSADGLYLRYFSMNPETEVWTIYERKLENGQEREIYTIEGDTFPMISSDTAGDHWLYMQRDQETKLNRFTLIQSSGVSELIAEDPREEGIMRRIFGDALMTSNVFCEADCTIEMTPLIAGQPTMQFTLPVSGSIVNPLRQIDDTHLLLQDDQTIWLLGADGFAEQVGYWNARSMIAFDNAISPDSRYILAFESSDDPTTYQLWDISNQQVVLKRGDSTESVFLVQAFYGEGGILVTENVQRFSLYRFGDGANIQLPESNGIYFDVLADGTVLYNHSRSDEAREQGIYRYDPNSETFTLFVPDARSIWAEVTD
ncbi:MAG: hypothetical protein K8L97_27410 [Anaerolineae bacterium]|nr:hypothetical protein [Anaerolineae bacterium]